MKYAGSADTTLAVELKAGDTTVTLTNGTGWYNGSTVYNRHFLWFGYTNSKGYTYPNYTYSRNTSSVYDTNWANGTWAEGGISGNVITLRVAWAGPTIPAGAAISNASSGSGYKYIALSATDVPNAWTRYEGYIGGYDTDRNNSGSEFPYGTAFVKLLILPNYTGTTNGDYIRFSDIWFSELSTRNLEAASGSVPGIVTTGAQNIAGDKTFNNAIIATGGITGAATGAPDRPIWTISKQYPSYGMFFNEGTPDRIEFKADGTVHSAICLENGTTYFNIVSGNVGIGKSDPAEKLDVNGTIKATSLIATGAFGCNGQSAKTAYASGGELNYSNQQTSGAYGFKDQATRMALVDLVIAIRAALVANGIMS
jgi:hypothetical protein